MYGAIRKTTRSNLRGAGARRSFRPALEILEDRSTPATLPGGFQEAVVASGLSNATAMELAPDGRIWVLEQAGDVKVFHNGSTTGWNALHIPSTAISSSGERGLLGIAFDPSYDITSAAADFVYLYYTSTASPNPHNRVSRFTVNNSNPDQPVLGAESIILELDALSGATNHNGGAIHFAADGKLYVAVGDNANGANSQSLGTLLGKMLRINSDGTIPSDNPFFNQATGKNRAIWALGLRNPFTFTIQPGSGRMHINDVGENTWEEIDVGAAGANYGWPTTEGDFNQSQFPSFTRPFYAYSHGSGTFQGNAITGGAFYNPSAPASGAFPASYNGDYFFADFVGDWINVIDLGTRVVSRFATDALGTVDLRVAPDGGLDYLARGQGQVLRVTFTGNQNPTPPFTMVGGDGQTFLLDAQSQLWRLKDGVYTYSGSGGLEIAVGNVGDNDPTNDVVFLRDAGSKMWVWNQTFWTDTGGWLPSLRAGDNQVFSVGFDSQVWRYRIGSGWTASGGYGVELVVGSKGDANPANDVVFLRGYHQGDPANAGGRAVWVWDQIGWWFSSGWLPSLVAGDGQVFGVGGDNQVWRYRVGGTGFGSWTASGGWGLDIAVANTGDANPFNDLVFLRASDNTIWLWTQTTWGNLGQKLTKMAAGDDQVFGIAPSGELRRYRATAPTGWTSSGFVGDRLAVGSGLDGNVSNDLAFLMIADGSVKTWQPG